MKVASSQLNFSGGHSLRIRQEQDALLQRQLSTSTATSTDTTNRRTTAEQQNINISEQVSLNSSQRYNVNTQSYVTNANDKDDNALFNSEKVIDASLSRSFTQNTGMQISQISIIEPSIQPSIQSTIQPTTGIQESSPLPSNQNTSSTQATLSFGSLNVYEEEEHTNFSIIGKVTTEEGKEVSFTLSAQLERHFSIEKRSRILAQNTQQTDPLAINLNGGIVTLRDSSFQFDLDSDGEKEEISFASQGSGFIVFDKNKDGKINDGSEMFGTQSGNGFTDLAQYDDDNNGVIDENDDIYDKLQIWTKDGAEGDHLISLKESGVGAIGLAYDDTQFELRDNYNISLGSIQRSGYFLMESGEAGFVQQVDLSERNLQMEEKVIAQFEPSAFSFDAPERPNNVSLALDMDNLPSGTVLTLEQATFLSKRSNDNLLAKYDEITSVEKSEETKSLLEQLVEKLEQYGAEQKDKTDEKES